MHAALRDTTAGCTLAVRVQPRASRTAILGMHDTSLKIALVAPPVDGAANDALLRFLADKLDIPRSDLSIASGEHARNKTIRIPNITASDAASRLHLTTA